MIKFGLILGLLLVEEAISVSLPVGLTSRIRREAVAAVAAEEAKKDLSLAETRIDPYLYDRPGFIGPIVDGGVYNHMGPYGPGYGPGGAGLAAGYGVGAVGLHKPFIGGHPYLESGGYNSGLYRSGINEGALALGNKGEELLRQQIDRGYADGNFHEGGGGHQGGYQGVEGYNDNKHHIADDRNNRLYYNGVRGGRQDLGNGQVFDKNQGYAQNSYNALGDNELKGHQRGHHKNGFHKSYHKDESGNDESYYDSDHDEGNHELGKKYGDSYDTNYLSGTKGGQNINQYAADEEGRGGFEGNGKLLSQNQGFKDYYGNNGYFNGGKHYGRLGGGGSSGYGKFGVNHGYQNGFNNGRNFEGIQGSKYGNGYYGPLGY